MELARYVVEAVVLEGRSYREVAKAHGVSKSWVAKVVSRYRQGGYEAIGPQSRAPHRTPHRTPPDVEDAIVRLRKELLELGHDAGATTIAYHLEREIGHAPAISTVHRVLVRRGFITPEPHKRPRSSWQRFEAALPNECWQSDVTHWRLADDTEVQIVNFIDDHSRLCVASVASITVTAPKVVEIFVAAGQRHGFPSRLLTDNGCVYTTWHRGGPNAMQLELLSRGIAYRHSRPYHPQTCGKVERFHQTLKDHLATRPKVRSVKALQLQIDAFVDYYNQVRPHRALGRRTPAAAWAARDRAKPEGVALEVGAGVRVRRDRIDRYGKLTLRHNGRLHHIGMGAPLKNRRVIMMVHGLDVRVLSESGELFRRLTLDTTRDYQPQASTMTRDMRPR